MTEQALRSLRQDWEPEALPRLRILGRRSLTRVLVLMYAEGFAVGLSGMLEEGREGVEELGF
ncbi:MAG: hypothetical protein A3J71_08370 [Pseudomonadales bacterium RIFCSPHIGHO2_02_FULL_60_43]|nr:MAG: hypothetical protein A3J71_08370 [Pseudomonadales bacterium RIFCSPHIGHO2_02_FULL_60_43]